MEHFLFCLYSDQKAQMVTLNAAIFMFCPCSDQKAQKVTLNAALFIFCPYSDQKVTLNEVFFFIFVCILTKRPRWSH